MNEELTRVERWDLLKTKAGITTIPWDRMVIPPHHWLDEVKTLDSIDADFKVHKGKIIRVPTKLSELSNDEIEYLKMVAMYREEDKKFREQYNNKK